MSATLPELTDRSKAGIAYRLKLTRDVFGLDQKEFAARAGIAANTFNQYETATNVPALEVAHKLCDAYRITLDWIFRGDFGSLRHDTARALEAMHRLRSGVEKA